MRHIVLTSIEEERLISKLYRWQEWAKASLRPFHEHLLEVEQQYEAIPESRTKTMPYMGAPNYVIPAIRIETQSMTAKEMSRFFQTDPLWTKKGLTENQAGIENLRKAQETFLNYVGIERCEMDLYGVYGDPGDALINNKNKAGMAVLKMPWIKRFQTIVKDDGEIDAVVLDSGPRPYRVALENMLFHPTKMKDEDKSDILGEIMPMTRDDLLERKRDHVYYSDAVDKVLTQPDEQTATPAERQAQSAANIQPVSEREFSENWLPTEFWIRWYIPEGGAKTVDDRYFNDNGRLDDPTAVDLPAGTYHLIVMFHWKTRTILRNVVNFYPLNMNPYIFWYMAKHEGTAIGAGYADILNEVQRMQSDGKNQRAANAALANCRIWIGKAKLANQSRAMYPNAFWTTENPNDDIKSEQMGDVYPSAFEEESSNWDLTSRITGNPEAQQGSGAGQVGKTNGTYTALPALAAMQMGNTRGDIRVCDSQYFHMRVGLKTQLWYAHFGIEPKLLKKFGDLGAEIENSFKMENLDRLLIPTRAATSSNNIEVDRQNGQLIDGMLEKSSQEMTQMLIAAGNPQTPDPIAQYLWNWLQARTLSLRTVTKAFNYDDTNRYVPDLPSAGDFMAFRKSTEPPPSPPGPPAGGPAQVAQGGGPPAAGSDQPPGPAGNQGAPGADQQPQLPPGPAGPHP